MSQCAKLHIAGWTWAVFTRVCLQSCTWPLAIFTMDQRKGRWVCIKFCANLGKSATETLTIIQPAFGDQSLSHAQVFQLHARFKTGRTSVDDDEHTGRPRSCTTPETVARIKELVRQIVVGPFMTLLRRWELVMGLANGFWRKNWECTMSQPNLCPGSWQLTRSTSASTSALSFVSSPPMMKPSCPGSSLVMRAGFTVITLRQSNNPPSGKSLHHQGQIRPDRWKATSRAWSSLSLTSRGLYTKSLSQQAKMWILGSTTTFCGDWVKTCGDVAPNFGENSPGCFAMTTPHLTHFHPHPAVSDEKQNGCHPPPTILPWFGTLWLLPISKNEIEAERMPVWYHWVDTGRIAENAWQSDRKGLPGSVPKMKKTMGPVSTCGRELLQGWRWPIGLMVSFTIFIASV